MRTCAQPNIQNMELIFYLCNIENTIACPSTSVRQRLPCPDGGGEMALGRMLDAGSEDAAGDWGRCAWASLCRSHFPRYFPRVRHELKRRQISNAGTTWKRIREIIPKTGSIFHIAKFGQSAAPPRRIRAVWSLRDLSPHIRRGAIPLRTQETAPCRSISAPAIDGGFNNPPPSARMTGIAFPSSAKAPTASKCRRTMPQN